MNRQDILALGILIVTLGLFFGLATPKKHEVGKFDGKNINFMAGETFTLTIDRSATSDAEIYEMNGESMNYPFSENWADFGSDSLPDRDEITLPEKFTDTKNTKNGKWDKALAFDRNTNPDPHYDNYSSSNPNGTEKNDQWDKGEKFTDVDGNTVWTAHLLEFRWEKVISGKRGVMYGAQTIPLSPVKNKPYILEYEGNDVGELNIKLTVIDRRSSSRNGYPVVVSESFSYTCNKILEEAPIIKGQSPECCDKVL